MPIVAMLSPMQCWPLAVDDVAAGWIIIGLSFIGLLSCIGLYCRLGLLQLDKEDAAADERQKGILW